MRQVGEELKLDGNTNMSQSACKHDRIVKHWIKMTRLKHQSYQQQTLVTLSDLVHGTCNASSLRLKYAVKCCNFDQSVFTIRSIQLHTGYAITLKFTPSVYIWKM